MASYTGPEDAAKTRLDSYYNDGSYHVTTNPGGLADGGHVQNFVPALDDIALLAGGIATMATTAENEATDAETARTGAETAETGALAAQSAAEDARDDAESAAASIIASNAVIGTKTDTASTSSSTWADTGLSVSITLAGSANKVLLTAHVTGGVQGATNTTFGSVSFRLVRSGSPDVVVLQGDAASNRERVHFSVVNPWVYVSTVSEAELTQRPFFSAGGQAVDTPGSTGPHTYKLQWRLSSISTAAYLNRNHDDSDSDTIPRGACTLSAIEIEP